MSGHERRRAAPCQRRRLLLLGSIASITTAHAEVEFTPSLSVGVSHTDNLLLAEQNPETETVYQVTPEFSLRQTASRLNAAIDYRAEGYRYRDRNDDDVHQNYLASFESALDLDNFFLDLGASRDQTIRDPEAPIPRTNLPITTNRVDREERYVGPRFQYPIGANATARGSKRRTHVKYDEVDAGAAFVPEFDTDAVAFSVDNYRQQQGFTWSFAYNADATDYGPAFPVWEYRQAAVEIGTWAGRGTRVFVSAGKESSWDDPLDPSLADDFHEIGIAKSAGPNFNVELAAGKRSFGSSKRATLDYTFRRGSTQLSYSDQPSTQGRSPEDYLTRPGAVERFVLKRLDWSLNIGFRRTQLSLNIFDETREGRTSIDGTPLGDEAQSGGSFQLAMRVGSRSGLQVGVQELKQEFAATGSQDLLAISVGANRPLGPRTDLALTLSRELSEDSGRENYEANLVSLLLTRRFDR